jgi:hypothetical protein
VVGKGFKLKGDKKFISIYNKTCKFVFKTVIHTKHRALYCAIMKRKLANGFNVSVTEEKPMKKFLKTSVKRAHKCLGHLGELMTRAAATHLGMILLRGALPVCESCAIAKANQRNTPKGISDKSKANKFNGRIYHNLAKIKVPEEFEGVTITKFNWHILVDEATKFKRSKFFETKGGIVEDLPQYMHGELLQGHPIKILRQDNTKENVAAIKMAQGKDWKIVFKAEFTVQKTPQQNLIAEMAFTVIAAQAQSMMNVVHLPDELRFKLWAETVMTATYLNILVSVTLNREKKT